ncbi:hypothetical protein F4803DRAFT_491153 [Xylaria telfairii]|nr:hypothetical protein F4803DRAFT_491153 [Xylaria telfairii]
MAANPPKTPRERLEDLTGHVHSIEAVFQVQFAQWSKKGFGSAAEYFLWAYTETIQAMELIRAENYKSDVDPSLAPDLASLFQRVVKLLHQAVEHVKVAKQKLTPVHKGLLENVLRINNTPDINHDGLNMHQIKMANQLSKIQPPNRAAWVKDGKDLKSDSEFDRVYQDFCDLKRDTGSSQTRHEMYASKSWKLLESAIQALHLPVGDVYPDEDFFDNDARWTFVDYPSGSDEFLYGKNGRPGMLVLKNKLGGILTRSERDKMNASIAAVAPKAKTAAVVVEDTQKPKGKNKETKKKMSNETNKKESKKQTEKKVEPSKSKGKNKSKKNKKAPTNNTGPYPKKQRTGWGGYTMNRANAEADVKDCLRDSKFTDVWDEGVDRPGSKQLLTPTVETRRTTLVAYHDDLRYIIEEIYRRRFGMPTTRDKLPQTALDRKAWLAVANKELAYARAGVYNLIDEVNTPAKAKRLRLAAYKLKLVRAMYTLGLVSGKPMASAREIQQGLIGRLDDWILHEQAWNSAEELIMGRPGLRQETYDIISGQFDQRHANIARWKKIRAEVKKGTGSDIEYETGSGLNNEIEFGELELQEDQDASDEENEEPEVANYYKVQQGDVEIADYYDVQGDVEVADYYKAEEGDVEVTDYYEVQKGDEEVAMYYKVQEGGVEVADYYKVQKGGKGVANYYKVQDDAVQDKDSIANYFKVQEDGEGVADYFQVQEGGEETADYFKVQEGEEVADYFKVQQPGEEIADYFKVQEGGEEVIDYFKVLKGGEREEVANYYKVLQYDGVEEEEPEQEEVERGEPEEEEVEEEEPEEEEVEQEEPEEEELEENGQDPFDTQLTDQQKTNGWSLLRSVLRPRLPDAGNYLLDWREERRRRRWFGAAARAKLANQPLPPWNHLPITDIFAAGGPPNHDKLPRKTTWERLQYMLVQTYWRFYQLRLMEP